MTEQASWKTACAKKWTSEHVVCNTGSRVPEGLAAVGWRVGVYWRDDQKFYMGEIAAYNEEDDEYEMNYDDSKLPFLLLPACVAHCNAGIPHNTLHRCCPGYTGV